MPERRTIGVDLGGTKLLVGAVDPGHNVHYRVQRTVSGLDQASLLDVAVDAVNEVRESSGAEVAAIGFGIPCLLDRRTGEAVIAVNLPLADIAFADVMSERLDLPVFVDNDGNVAALAEHRAGAARGCSEAVVLTIGTGIGGGLILRGEPYRGWIGSGAELGHIVIDMDGPPCQ
jgi:glucokinase